MSFTTYRWILDAFVFDSNRLYATPSYWMQKKFIGSSGATFLQTMLTTSSSNQVIASAIKWQSHTDKKNYLRIKVIGAYFNLFLY